MLAGALAGCLELGDALADPYDPRVVLVTSMGNITLQLFERQAPISVANFLNHTRAGHYEGTIFHRVIQGFVAQGGGVWPNGTEKSNPFPPIPLEVHPDLTHRDGCLGMARTDDLNSATSQFYLCDGPQHRLDDAQRQAERGERGYAVFGRVDAGMPVLRAMTAVDTDSADRPIHDILLREVVEEPRRR